MTAETLLLAARGAGRSFGRRVALAPTDLELAEGEVVALLGPNGAGKSTLLALLAGALRPTTGAIERRPGARIGWVPQRPALYGRLTARENLELFARLEGERAPATAAERLVDTFSLPAGPAERLSVGNRQRLNVAIGLLGDPQALLLDEPTASLDPPQRRRLWESLAGLGRAVFFATQHHEEAERARRAIVLVEGEVVFDGDAGGREVQEILA